MGRSAQHTISIDSAPLLFAAADLPVVPTDAPEKNFQSLRHPLWTENKAWLICKYLKLFTLITRHGTYIDGFAAPQESDHPGMWSAKLVLENEPKWMRNFWLCDLSPAGIERLTTLAEAHVTNEHQATFLAGDFNNTVDQVLASGHIKAKTATFALLDQRTFECSWSTVQKLAAHKKEMKVEQFYFFASGWLIVRLPQ